MAEIEGISPLNPISPLRREQRRRDEEKAPPEEARQEGRNSADRRAVDGERREGIDEYV